MPSDDVVANGQSEAGTAGFGGKERLEDFFTQIGGYPGTFILYLDQNLLFSC